MSKRINISLVLLVAFPLIFISPAHALEINRHDQLDHLKYYGYIAQGDQAIVNQNGSSMVHQAYVVKMPSHPTLPTRPPSDQIRYKEHYLNGPIPEGSLRLDDPQCAYHIIGKVDIEAEGNFVAAIWEQQTEHAGLEIHVAYSDDEGRSFNHKKIYQSTHTIDNTLTFLQGSTRLVLDETGRMLVFGQEHWANNVHHQNVFVLSSGETWSKNIINRNHPAKYAPNGLSVVRNGSEVNVAYLGNNEESLVFVQSSDFGRTWTGDQVIAPTAFSSGNPDAVIASMTNTVDTDGRHRLCILGSGSVIESGFYSTLVVVCSGANGEWDPVQIIDRAFGPYGIVGQQIKANPEIPSQLWVAYLKKRTGLYWGAGPNYMVMASGSHEGGLPSTWEEPQTLADTGINQFRDTGVQDDQFKGLHLDPPGIVWFSRSDPAGEGLTHQGSHIYLTAYNADVWSWETRRIDNLLDWRAVNPKYARLNKIDDPATGAVAFLTAYSEVTAGFNHIKHRNAVTLSLNGNISEGGVIENPPLGDENQVPDTSHCPTTPIEDPPNGDDPSLDPIHPIRPVPPVLGEG